MSKKLESAKSLIKPPKFNSMKPIRISLLCICFCIFNSLQAQEIYSKVKINIPPGSERVLRQFIFDSLDADHFQYEKRAVVIEITERHLNRLKNTPFSFDVLIPDVADNFRKTSNIADFYNSEKVIANKSAYEKTGAKVTDFIQTPSSFTPGSMGGYYTYTEMISKIDALVTTYPALISKINIGTSYLGNTIWGVKISDNVATDETEPEVLYTGLQHAREAITGTSLIFFMQYLCENYSSNTDIRDIVDNREVFIIPCVNVDGYLYNQSTNPSGGGLWRKNRKLNSGGSYGVDLNRNYSMDWGCCSGGSSIQSDETYWGSAAFSEPETQAIKAFVTSRNFVIGFDQHCYGSYYSLPFGIAANHTLDAVDAKVFTFSPALIGKHNGHRAGNSIQTVGYNVAGGIKDWLFLGDIGTGTKGKIYSWTGEAGGGSFWAPTSSIIPLSKELCFQNIQIAYTAGSYADIQDMSDIAITSTTGNLSFQIRRIGLSNQPVTVTALPLENIQTVGSAITINSIANYHETYSGNISFTLPAAIPSGKRIRFAWKVETGSITFYDTITKFYNPITLLSDDMEGILSGNWSLPSGGTASSKWGFETTTAFSGTKALSESVGGDYLTNDSRWVQYKNAMDLSDATAAYLSFWVKHRAENFRDKLQIQISTNNSTWTAIQGKNTVNEDNTTNGGTLGGQPALTGIRENWTRELVDLSSYKGNTTVYLRFLFTSDGDGGAFYKERDDGFYLDNVKVIKSTTSFVTLGVNFINFSGYLLPSKQVDLEWKAVTDNEHDYFEIERSADGIYFTTLGRIQPDKPNNFTDKHPFTGLNYYRIKAVDINKKVQYSKVININNNSLLVPAVSLYPNPVVSDMKVTISGPEDGKVQWKLIDNAGRVIMQSSTHVIKGNGNNISISMDKLATGSYYLSVSGAGIEQKIKLQKL